LALASQAQAAAPVGLATTIAGSALAIAGNATQASATFFEIMTTTKTLVSLAAITGLLGIGYSLFKHHQVRQAEDALAAATTLHAQSAERLAQMEARALSTRRALADLQLAAPGREAKAQANGGVKAAAENSAAAASPPPRPTPPSINRELSADPVVRKHLAEWIKGNFTVGLVALYRSLGLSPEKIDALENLMVQYDINMGVWLSLRPDSVSVADLNRSIKDLLGAADYEKFHVYKRTEFIRRVANGLAGNLYFTDTPLTPSQADRLTEMLAATTTQYKKDQPPFPSMVNWDAALNQATTILTPPQLAVFNNEVQILSSQPGLWSGMNTIYPGSIGISGTPPASIFAPPGSP
jgi:hypothetical protein